MSKTSAATKFSCPDLSLVVHWYGSGSFQFEWNLINLIFLWMVVGDSFFMMPLFKMLFCGLTPNNNENKKRSGDRKKWEKGKAWRGDNNEMYSVWASPYESLQMAMIVP